MSNFSNSSLINYTKISKNSTNPRNHAIDTISIHTMAGNCTVETCGQIFTNSNGASSNYGIDSKGRIGLYVEEKNRSWCTSNKANDHRAITIEVASIRSGDYKCSDTAMKALITLCVDICKRNNIKKLVWSDNKDNRINHKYGCNMTVHRDYAQKSCPGDYLYGKMGYIADEVNKILFGITKENTNSSNIKTSNEQIMWKMLDNNGLNDYAKAGIMASVFAESGLEPRNLQNSFEKKLGYNDITYTKAVDNGKYKDFAKDGAGYGLCQWTYHTRKQALLDYAKKKEMSIGNLKMQISFMLREMKSDIKLVKALAEVSSIKEASDLILLNYERPADQSDKEKKKRASYAQEFFDKYKGKSNIDSYKVRITASSLSIRSKPGTNSTILGSIKKNNVFTIIEECNGPGASKWGLLKSKKGWISLDYVEKI